MLGLKAAPWETIENPSNPDIAQARANREHEAVAMLRKRCLQIDAFVEEALDVWDESGIKSDGGGGGGGDDVTEGEEVKGGIDPSVDAVYKKLFEG